MARNVFFSFHYKPDNWRVAQVRNIGAIEGNKPASDNKWEEVVGGGEKAIKDWINDNLKNKSCTIVLVGEKTSGRKWINYEIKKSWEDGKGVLGIYIHNLKNKDGEQSRKGKNPFSEFTIGEDKTNFDKIVNCYDPPYKKSTNVYNYIKENIEDWIEEAIKIKENNYI